jgi:hypothetical protein
MRTTLTTASVVVLLATGAGSAAARPIDLTDGAAARPTQPTASQALRDREHGIDQPAGPAVPASRQPAPAPIVHVTRLIDGGFDWADAGIGAGLTAALLLSAAGASALRRQHPVAR